MKFVITTYEKEIKSTKTFLISEEKNDEKLANSYRCIS